MTRFLSHFACARVALGLVIFSACLSGIYFASFYTFACSLELPSVTLVELTEKVLVKLRQMVHISATTHKAFIFGP